ncbi:helix-turn-helix domain-containing protein [Streptomyces sp. AcH 505]|uniref:helix-turn-helix domain-containing protein n=1 Tax=Streptomyces sp. AcH 505 TaxID=352211 RepID=UPI000AFC3D06
MTTALRREALTVAQLYDQPPLMPLWPTFGQAICGMSESTTYQLAAEDRLPIETVRMGRKRYVRTADVLAWLHLPTTSETPAVAPAEASDEHDQNASQQIGA